MKIYPAIDLIEGQVVRLTQGCFDQQTTYGDDPVAVAKTYKEQGAEYLHVVDLDGAKGDKPRQTNLIKKIALESGLKLQVGGGIRTLKDAQELVDVGVDRIILGSIAVKDVDTTLSILEGLGGERITLGLDVMLNSNLVPMVATSGWQEVSDVSADKLLKLYTQFPSVSVLCTDIGKDGTLEGPNFDLYGSLMKNWPEISFLASGGVARKSDISRLKEMEMGGVIIGKALYEGRFSLEEVLTC